MKLVLHIGTQKTGTTSIQKFLDVNRNLLRQKKFYVNTVCLSDNHIEFAARFNTFDQMKNGEFFQLKRIKSSYLFEKWKKDFDVQVVNDLEKASKFKSEFYLVSTEFFSTSSTGETVAELKSWVFKHFESIKVILFFRDQVSLCESWYSTKLRQGFSGSLTDYAKSLNIHSQVYATDALSLLYENNFGLDKVKLIPYENNDEFDSVTKFIEVNKIPITKNELSSNKEKSNKNLSFLGQELLAHWNRLNPIQNSFSKDWIHRKILINNLEQNFFGNPARLDYENAKRIKDIFEHSNRSLLLRHGIKLVHFSDVSGLNRTQLINGNSNEKFNHYFQRLTRKSPVYRVKEILFFFETKVYLFLARTMKPQKIRNLKKLKSIF